MNREEAVESMAIFLESANLESAREKGVFDEDTLAEFAEGSMRDLFRTRAGDLYDHMDSKGLIVKP
jgi:hypothetical protein